ncbi:pseudoazurin [Curvivirga sp.]|uniref:pseudoazurin n=1 Tax=Curvivirga sp. TaxID=2856848 RepID=UPI003B5AE035
MNKRHLLHLLCIALCVSFIVGIATLSSAQASSPYHVQMLNERGSEKFVFNEEIIRISVGDTIVFEPTTKGHNAASIKALAPDQATKFKTPYNKEAEVTFSVPGIYGVKCTPHAAAGMVAIIVVGEEIDSKVDLSKVKLPKKAKSKLEQLISQL